METNGQKLSRIITISIRLIPPEILVVSESGITSGAQLKELMGSGLGAFLIGEHFMRAADPGEALRQILREAEVL